MKRVVLAFVLAPLLFVAIAILAFLPAWMHVLDHGVPVAAPAAAYSINELTRFNKTRHLSITATPRADVAIVAEPLRRVKDGAVEPGDLVLVPLVDATWQPGQPVTVVLATEMRDLGATPNLVGGGTPLTSQAEARNALWEGGFTAPQRELLAASGAPLSPDALLLTRAGTRSDWFWAYGMAGLALVLGLLAGEGHRRVWRRRQRRAATARI